MRNPKVLSKQIFSIQQLKDLAQKKMTDDFPSVIFIPINYNPVKIDFTNLDNCLQTQFPPSGHFLPCVVDCVPPHF